MRSHMIQMIQSRISTRIVVAMAISVFALLDLLPMFTPQSSGDDACPIETLACTITVPGTANPWLAGAPAGTPTGDGDSAPGQSPALVSCLPVNGGDILKFSATGTVSNCPSGCSVNGPDGGTLIINHAVGALFNSDITAPVNSLVAVFLGPSAPVGPPPIALDFSSSRNFSRLSPLIAQVFFIGDGLGSIATIGVTCQEFVVPCGATRLFLGVMDGFEWNNNTGSFSVTVHKPATFDICLQDDLTGNRLQIDSSSGSYRFTQSATGSSLVGRGTLVISTCAVTLKDSIPQTPLNSGRIVDVTFFSCDKRASGFIRISSISEPSNDGSPAPREIITHGISDSNTSDSACGP